MRKIASAFIFVAVMLMFVLVATPQMALAKRKVPKPPVDPVVTELSQSMTMWINHLDFLPGDSSVTTSFNAITSGVGSGLSGLMIHSSTTGEDATGGGNKVVEKGLQVPPGFLISGVRVCYELSNPPVSSFISQIRLAQVQDPPDTALVLLDDGTDLTDPGPICVDSEAPSTPVDPSQGAVRLSFRVNFLDTADVIVLRAVGLRLVIDPNGPIEHTHIYLTGKGVGHNNTEATTSPPVTESDSGE